ncbi:MAG: laminarinase [Flavobacterium sp. BFFFF1]|uniref:family 16 glycosylhydrolase n=1 Tax=unclassified Flavobacterium TaxID=196869 RepID=UPI000BC76272|nr:MULTISPECIES: family 16 glycosylhydrolase [unclassified Flavobacterium]OYU79442.1 MAG: laminarinase [Flavobacterium sp. BFFFF1]
MKKLIQKTAYALAFIFAFAGCQDDEHNFGNVNAPGNLQVATEIVGQDADNPNGDGSGFVNFTATATDAISYKYIFSDDTNAISGSGELSKRFTQPGLHTYTVTVLANGTGGVSTSTSFEITVQSNFKDDEAVQFLTGGSSKKWYWAASELGHLGVGPNSDNAAQNYFGFYYQAQPFEKAGSPDSSCLYDNELTFSLDGTTLKYQLDNGGRTFFNTAFLSVGGGSGSSDLCLNYDASGVKTVTLSPSESIVPANLKRGTAMTFSDGGFMGYYIQQSTYEIMSITENRMVVRAVMGGNEALAWYHTFSTQPPTQPSDDTFDNLVFEDNFDVAGAPDPTKWSYNIGAGGWGNNEVQYYTNSTDNAIVADGMLKITAKRQNLSGSEFTSARLVSENKFEFTYGKIEFRAKLPTGGGTWPALWALGQNYATNTWPACGEIDVMEHKGNNPNVIYGTLHYPGASGGTANGNNTTITNATTDFHIYSAVWSSTSIKFYVDGNLYHSYANVAGSPFNADFFLIMNVAMGGNFGGTIDPAFTQSTMEVDYVRVYQ